MPAGPPAHLRDELLRRRRLIVRADLVIWHQARPLSQPKRAEARRPPPPTMPLPSGSRDETDRSRGQAATELPVARKGGRTRHVITVCGGNLARVRFPPPPLIAGSPCASRNMMTSGDFASVPSIAAGAGKAGIGGVTQLLPMSSAARATACLRMRVGVAARRAHPSTIRRFSAQGYSTRWAAAAAAVS
jgi:hypothetical protein